MTRSKNSRRGSRRRMPSPPPRKVPNHNKGTSVKGVCCYCSPKLTSRLYKTMEAKRRVRESYDF